MKKLSGKRECRQWKKLIWENRKGFGMNEVLGVAAALVIAAFVVIPGLRTFATTVTQGLATWWTTISASIFKTS